ncbi:hypothetical protein FJ661_06355 [Pseudarthrobacter phenanthrenivorans]|uniref:PQ-loop repeat-containing protein n=1 Tax=Pseudarthrobacter phenanthrenivorans (strain DSM 18606 / JCM 16027 / LMG 23796 / Sphe3) TaxID=930171 RepID=F0M943_PSEPM|nr:hypothetical protein [Pseudarthrobacter phenanthrenivorans]ADX73843.1 hypothetical protein Asphe3_27240 [Pseudarthrobacter phenanthrenivorans Sphe3]TPV52026.1 hypothetical protein FJ661_06355 [Pseudarthrobacter phenanthrenivorans]
MNLPVLAGTLSTVLFAVGMLPMLVKAARTRDLASYSLGNLVLSNVANAIHCIYVFNLPAGPIWALHLAYVLASALMLAWWLRYRNADSRSRGARPAGHQEGSQAGIHAT